MALKAKKWGIQLALVHSKLGNTFGPGFNELGNKLDLVLRNEMTLIAF